MVVFWPVLVIIFRKAYIVLPWFYYKCCICVVFVILLSLSYRINSSVVTVQKFYGLLDTRIINVRKFFVLAGFAALLIFVISLFILPVIVFSYIVLFGLYAQVINICFICIYQIFVCNEALLPCDERKMEGDRFAIFFSAFFKKQFIYFFK